MKKLLFSIMFNGSQSHWFDDETFRFDNWPQNSYSQFKITEGEVYIKHLSPASILGWFKLDADGDLRNRIKEKYEIAALIIIEESLGIE